ncbi:MAG: sigma-70 family RNA polymerase sigma factor [Bacillota bacterium]
MKTPDERALVKRAKQNDKDAMEELFRINYPVLLGALVRIIGDADFAEDIAQEAVLSAIVNLERYQPRAKFSTWLISIALNKYRNKLRVKTREVSVDSIDKAHSGTESVEDPALQRVAAAEARDILECLSPEKRQVFVLKHYYGFKYKEIAEAVGCPVGTVRSRLHDSIKILRQESARRGLI